MQALANLEVVCLQKQVEKKDQEEQLLMKVVQASCLGALDRDLTVVERALEFLVSVCNKRLADLQKFDSKTSAIELQSLVSKLIYEVLAKSFSCGRQIESISQKLVDLTLHPLIGKKTLVKQCVQESSAPIGLRLMIITEFVDLHHSIDADLF